MPWGIWRPAPCGATWEEFIQAKKYSEPKQIVKLSDYVMRQQGDILGHLVRAPKEDMMKLPTIGELQGVRQ